MEGNPPPDSSAAAGAGTWQSVEACLQALSRGSGLLLDAGGYARADAYAFLYGRLEATADLEETPAELRGVVGAQHGPALVAHITQALRAAAANPVEHAEQASKYLPLLAVLLSHECCCRALDAQPGGGGQGGAAALGVLGTLVDILLEGQARLVATTTPPAPSTTSISTNAAAGSSPAASVTSQEREARVMRLPLADLCLHLLDALAYQRCDLSRAPEPFLVKLLRALQLAVDGKFGPLAPSLPAQGLHVAIRLLPRLAPLPGAAASSRGLLKAILRRALAATNPAEAGMAVDALRGAMQTEPTPLLVRDPLEEEGEEENQESYHACIVRRFDAGKYDGLKAADPVTALRLTGVLVQLLNPTHAETVPIMHKLWDTIQGFLFTKGRTEAARLLQLEALAVWSAYVGALAQLWPAVPSKRRRAFKPVVKFLVLPIAKFLSSFSSPSEQMMELEVQVLALLNTLLAATEWRQWLWPPPSPAPGDGQQQQPPKQKTKEEPKELLPDIVLKLLGMRHTGGDADLGTLRFDAGMVCLAELVPGAVPRELLLRDGALRGWRRVPALDTTAQHLLLTAATPVLASQRVTQRFFEAKAERRQQLQLLQQQANATQSQSQTADAKASAAALPPPPPQPRALRALLACWDRLLGRLLPSELAAPPPTETAAAVVDNALAVLRAPKIPLAVLHLLADEALRLLGPSEATVPPDSALWADVTRKVYKGSGEAPVPLGTLALGLRALLFLREDSWAEDDAAPSPARPLVLEVGPGRLPLPQLVDFLGGLLARCTDPEAEPVLPSPFLRIYYATLGILLAQPPSTSSSKQAHALALRVLHMLPVFAAQGAARVSAVFPSAEALNAEAGGPILEQWSNLLDSCLKRAQDPTGGAAGAAGGSQSQSQFAEWAVEDPAEAITAVADTVFAPLLPPHAPPASSKALAALWCPLGHRALRCLNTALNTRGAKGEGSVEAKRTRKALFAPALRLATALLAALQPATAPGSGASVCLCNTCGNTGSTSTKTWLASCLRPAPAAEEWTLEAMQGMAQALAAWWNGASAGSGSAGPCCKALAKEATAITRTFLDSLVGGGTKAGGGGGRQSLGGGGAAGASSSLLEAAAPGKALLALQPLLLALLSHGGEEGKARVYALWQGAGLGTRADLGLAGDGSEARALCAALQQLVRSGAIASKDPALGDGGSEQGAEAAPLAVAGNGNSGSSGGGRRASSSGSSSGSPSGVKKRPSSSSGGGGAAAAKRAKG